MFTSYNKSFKNLNLYCKIEKIRKSLDLYLVEVKTKPNEFDVSKGYNVIS